MSARERRQLELLARVRDKELTLAKAAELLGASYRQAKRLWKRCREEGDVGLAHRLRGHPSSRRITEPKR
ncbi:MAG: helix-turn-helix domain-containing protein [Verrucomicrobiia bacterium]